MVTNENQYFEIPTKFRNFPLPWVYIKARLFRKHQKFRNGFEAHHFASLGPEIERPSTRYQPLDHSTILPWLIGFGVFYSFSWTWYLEQRTVHHSGFIFSRVKGLIVFSGIFLLFKFSVWTVHFCMRFALRGSVNV